MRRTKTLQTHVGSRVTAFLLFVIMLFCAIPTAILPVSAGDQNAGSGLGGGGTPNPDSTAAYQRFTNYAVIGYRFSLYDSYNTAGRKLGKSVNIYLDNENSSMLNHQVLYNAQTNDYADKIYIYQNRNGGNLTTLSSRLVWEKASETVDNRYTFKQTELRSKASGLGITFTDAEVAKLTKDVNNVIKSGSSSSLMGNDKSAIKIAQLCYSSFAGENHSYSWQIFVEPLFRIDLERSNRVLTASELALFEYDVAMREQGKTYTSAYTYAYVKTSSDENIFSKISAYATAVYPSMLFVIKGSETAKYGLNYINDYSSQSLSTSSINSRPYVAKSTGISSATYLRGANDFAVGNSEQRIANSPRDIIETMSGVGMYYTATTSRTVTIQFRKDGSNARPWTGTLKININGGSDITLGSSASSYSFTTDATSVTVHTPAYSGASTSFAVTSTSNTIYIDYYTVTAKAGTGIQNVSAKVGNTTAFSATVYNRQICGFLHDIRQ